VKAVEKGVVKPLALSHKVSAPKKPIPVGRAYIMSKKEASNSSTVVITTLLLNSKPFSILFDWAATHSFISTQAALF